MGDIRTDLQMGDIFISYNILLVLVVSVFLLGIVLGFYVCKYLGGSQCISCLNRNKTIGTGKYTQALNGILFQDCKNVNDTTSQDGPIDVLMGSIDLLSSLWKGGLSSTKVVNYLSPNQMYQQLFTGSDSLRLDDGKSEETQMKNIPLGGSLDNNSPRSSAVDIMSSTSKNNNEFTSMNQSQRNFLQLLSSIQQYSVNTSHPFFFNQLFGSLDPIALAAEIVALSVNTSVYTYETAPVFTMLEREVMRNIGKLVFGVEGQNDEFKGEGLMIPGGSLANLTAMHAARHRWKVRNGFLKGKEEKQCLVEEEKKFDDMSLYNEHQECTIHDEDMQSSMFENDFDEPSLVAFVSSEAHYSFSKSARVLGIRDDDLIIVPTHEDGRMDVGALEKYIEELEHNQTSHQLQKRQRVPFFVACTAGSTVRGSFDDIAAIVKVCRNYESRGAASIRHNAANYQRTIWVHVDGAWGGSAIFSSRPSVLSTTHMDEVRYADSFTFNPHKMLGAPQQTTAFIVRHRNALKNANAARAKYLFDPRKNGAEYDLGDLSHTCGRRTDAVKLWAMWKYYGKDGLGARVDQKVDELRLFVKELKKRPSFALACRPWLFNVNFFYFPPRIRDELQSRGILIHDSDGDELEDNESFVQIPDDIAQDLTNVSVNLKLRLHEAGEMMIPYQPLNNQKADCFRLVLAGKKNFDIDGICHVLDTMEKYGNDL